jgi:hypothetical protein
VGPGFRACVVDRPQAQGVAALAHLLVRLDGARPAGHLGHTVDLWLGRVVAGHLVDAAIGTDHGTVALAKVRAADATSSATRAAVSYKARRTGAHLANHAGPQRDWHVFGTLGPEPRAP